MSVYVIAGILLSEIAFIPEPPPHRLCAADDKFAHDEAIRLALRRPLTDVTFEHTPFRQVIQKLRGLLGVNMHVQWRLLDDNGVSADDPVTLALERVSGGRLLRLILDDIDDPTLGFEIQRGVLVVSTFESLQQTRTLRTYSLRNLISPKRDPALKLDWSSGELKARANQIASTLIDLVAPDSWNVNGGTGVLKTDDGLLIIRQSPHVHAQMKALLAALQNAPSGGSHSLQRPSADELSQERAIRASLQRVLPTVSLTSVMLQDAFDWLRLMLDANMHVEWRQLESRGAQRDEKVKLELRNVTLERVLEQLLSDASAELAHEIIDGVLIISTAERLNRRMTLRIHDSAPPAKSDARRAELLDLITDTVEPDSWIVNGGIGTIRFINDRIVARNHSRAHAQTDRFLAELRRHNAVAPPAGSAKP